MRFAPPAPQRRRNEQRDDSIMSFLKIPLQTTFKKPLVSNINEIKVNKESKAQLFPKKKFINNYAQMTKEEFSFKEGREESSPVHSREMIDFSNLKISKQENLEDTILRASLENEKKRNQFFKSRDKTPGNDSLLLESRLKIQSPIKQNFHSPLVQRSGEKSRSAKKQKLSIPKSNFIQMLQKKHQNLIPQKSLYTSLMQKHKEQNSLKNSIYLTNQPKHLFEYNCNHLNNLKKYEKGSETQSIQDTLDERNFQSTKVSSKEINSLS